MEKILFNKVGRDANIDFIKAYAILCVVFGHAIPDSSLSYIGYGLWAGMQVPLFILVQSFHYFKKDKPAFDLIKLFKRIFVPFIIIQLLLVGAALIVKGDDKFAIVKEFVILGGYGPGAYFPWIYLQIAIILPVASWLITKIPKTYHVLIALLICEGFEMLFSYIDFPDSIYRILAIRYLFLIYLGYSWVNNGIVLNRKNLVLSLLSLITVVVFNYCSFNAEPLFYATSWSYHRWPCYFYVAIMGGWLLCMLNKRLSKFQGVEKSVRVLSQCSYEIFLVQMAFITVSTPFFDIISNDYARAVVRFIVIYFVSITFGVIFNKAYKQITK